MQSYRRPESFPSDQEWTWYHSCPRRVKVQPKKTFIRLSLPGQDLTTQDLEMELVEEQQLLKFVPFNSDFWYLNEELKDRLRTVLVSFTVV